MKKVLSMIINLVLMICIITAGIFGVKGYMLYRSVMSQTSIEEKIDDVMKNENYVKINGISDNFLNGIVAVEDHRFYNHGAIDIISIGRSVLTNLSSGRIVMGGSTITQQLAKNLFLTNEQKLERKIAEVILAEKLERKYTKQQILELYVNVIYYGDGYFGINEAAKGYFDKSPDELTFEEAVLLAGIPQSPENYSISKHYDRAASRAKIVINALVENNYMASDEVYYGIFGNGLQVTQLQN